MKINYGFVEKIIGYEFGDKELLLNAFTHASFANEKAGEKNNERLEFLGDSVLGLVVSEYLYKLGELSEGKMTFKKQSIVSSKPLASVCYNLGIESELLLGENVKITDNLRENLVESLIGAMYLDGGYEPCKNFIYNFIIKSDGTSLNKTDYKSELNEYVSKYRHEVKYETVDKSGLDNDPTHTVALYIDGVLIAKATKQGKKQLAEQEVARLALEKLAKR
ncbi:MAG: ribonuclease III [Clostridia bacterium]|nr:ribonuclease III [Clostridia bacterium]